MYFTEVREGEKFAALYRLDIRSKAVEKVFAFEQCDVLGVISDFADLEIVGVVRILRSVALSLVAQGREFEWMALGGEGHGAYDEESPREVYERILAFLDRHLKPAG